MQHKVITTNLTNTNKVYEMPALKIDSQGDIVILLQKILFYFGYLTSDALTGYYGSQTQTAIKNFQFDRGLPSDGNVDRQTWQTLIEDLPVFS